MRVAIGSGDATRLIRRSRRGPGVTRPGARRSDRRRRADPHQPAAWRVHARWLRALAAGPHNVEKHPALESTCRVMGAIAITTRHVTIPARRFSTLWGSSPRELNRPAGEYDRERWTSSP